MPQWYELGGIYAERGYTSIWIYWSVQHTAQSLIAKMVKPRTKELSCNVCTNGKMERKKMFIPLISRVKSSENRSREYLIATLRKINVSVGITGNNEQSWEKKKIIGKFNLTANAKFICDLWYKHDENQMYHDHYSSYRLWSDTGKLNFAPDSSTSIRT